MKTSARTRILTTIVAIFSMLFMQLAVAAYVCPGISGDSANFSASADLQMADMPDCESMDPAQPALCHVFAHGEQSKQSLDKSPVPDVQPFVPLALVAVLPTLDVVSLPEAAPFVPLTLARPTAPPIAIRNCCFRF